MSMPSGLNGKGTKHLKNENLRVSNYKFLSRPQKLIQGAAITMLHNQNEIEASVQIPSNLLFEPQELTQKILSLRKH